ncbi:hypothetical protein Goklo_024484 [Gossypium klotzschianum]|uniref:Uncharacterized protein n=2 Tax=Gossypium klotzschianum TaxID=34286 RepID=A0A7J8WEG3_9ROSI|nr:hypothetical protein [Gossypium klotzschianum]
MKRLAVGPMTTPEYNEWWVRRINDNIPEPSHENSQPIEEHLRVVPSELEIMKQDFERRNAELEKKDKANGRRKDELEIRRECSETRGRNIKKRES